MRYQFIHTATLAGQNVDETYLQADGLALDACGAGGACVGAAHAGDAAQTGAAIQARHRPAHHRRHAARAERAE